MVSEWTPLPWEGFKRWLLAHGVDVEAERVAAVDIEFTPDTVRAAPGVMMRVTTYRYRDGQPVREHPLGPIERDERLVPVRCPPGVIG